MSFLELLEEAEEIIDEAEEEVLTFLYDACQTEEDHEKLREELGLDAEEYEMFVESIVRRVNSRGVVRKTLSRKIRSARAVATTGRSKSDLRRSARLATKTKRRNPTVQRKAKLKTRKAMRRRRQMGI